MVMDVVCTRILDGGLKQEAMQHGIFIRDYDLLEITYLQNKEIEAAIKGDFIFVFTSVHGIKAVQNAVIPFQHKKCYCIAGNTRKVAEENGFEILGEAENGISLAKKIIEDKAEKLMHFTSNIRRHELKDELQKHGIVLQECVVYEKKLLPKAVGNFDAVMFFSPSQIDAFFAANALPSDIPAFCIGATTASHLASKHHKNIHTATQANASGLLQELYKYHQTHVNRH